MKKLYCGEPGFETEIARLFGRPAYPPEAEEAARAIIEAVRRDGDAALSEFARRFDRAELTPATFRVSDAEVAAAVRSLPRADRRAIDAALDQVQTFARLVKPKARTWSPRRGVRVGEKFTPMDRVGVYIPGGAAPLVSTVIHTAGIAAAAGVKEIVATTPPGGLHPGTLYAMKRAGVREIYRLGGVYGVAAMAIGTETIAPVEKIAGPGNAYVTAAKKLLFGEVSIDLVAGPSEILVIADRTADPRFVAADLLSQAEHGSGLEQAVLISTDRKLIDRVETELLAQKKLLSREKLIDRVLEKGLFLIWAPTLEHAAELANRYAPEHLELQVADPRRASKLIRAAGAIFMGPWTPEPAGDFCAGPSHVLPTASSARRFNGLSTTDFMRRSSMVEYSESALRREAEIIERFGNMEQLTAHANAATIRCKK